MTRYLTLTIGGRGYVVDSITGELFGPFINAGEMAASFNRYADALTAHKARKLQELH